MSRLKLDILGVAETRWSDSGACTVENGIFYYSGNRDNNHRNGVGVVVSRTLMKSVVDFVPHTDRTIMIRIKAKPVDLNIIQVYAPTADAADQDIEQFYSDVKELLKLTKKHEVNIIMGDLNAKLGKGRFENIIGPFGLGTRNERGDRLLQFCQEENMTVTNTWFQHHPRRLYTWKSPKDQAGNLIRNQIDYILIGSRFASSIKAARTYPGADINSDHILLMAVLRISLSRPGKRTPRRLMALDKLHNPIVKNDLANQLNSQIQKLSPKIEGGDVTQSWETIANVLKTTSQSVLGYRSNNKKQKWITNEILLLMDERRKSKTNRDRYKELQRQIRAKIRIAKNEWLKKECNEIEQLQRKHDDFNLHKKLKETAGIPKKRNLGIIVNEDNQIVLDDSEKCSIWEDYVEKLFNDNRPDKEFTFENNLSGPSITKEEIEKAIQIMKNNKAAGPDEIPSEILKLMDERGIAVLYKLFNQIYDTGHYPEQWLSSTFVPLPKKTNARKCEEHRLISLMSHSLKIFLRIIHRRLYKKCDSAISDSQFGFRQGLGTREALVATQVLIQNCYDQRKNVCLCFIDYEKAFDKVQHHRLMKLLGRLDLDQKDIRCIENLYWHQSARVRLENGLTSQISIRRGVRQGCILSPLLFNLYSEAIFQESLEDREIGIKVNGIWINNIRYADDTVLVADNIDDLQQLVDLVGEHSQNMGLSINTKKTKFMVVTREIDQFRNSSLTYEGKHLERVQKFKYLGTWLHEEWSSEKEIACRIEQARGAFMKFRKVLTCGDFDLGLRLRFVGCYVWSVLLYGMESWTLKASAINKLEAFEMWIYRRILKIPWTARMRNEDVLRRCNKERELFNIIKKRKTAYLGHIMRSHKYQFLHLIIEGKIEGRRGLGRKRMSWLRNVRQWTGIRDIQTLIHTARDREAMRNVVANIH